MLFSMVMSCDLTGERSSSGLLEWESINDAMEALAMMNHYQMKNPSKYLTCRSTSQRGSWYVVHLNP